MRHFGFSCRYLVVSLLFRLLSLRSTVVSSSPKWESTGERWYLHHHAILLCPYELGREKITIIEIILDSVYKLVNAITVRCVISGTLLPVPFVDWCTFCVILWTSGQLHVLVASIATSSSLLRYICFLNRKGMCIWSHATLTLFLNNWRLASLCLYGSERGVWPNMGEGKSGSVEVKIRRVARLSSDDNNTLNDKKSFKGKKVPGTRRSQAFLRTCYKS